MRTLILILGLFVLIMTSFESQAQTVPKYLEGATVVVKLKNGKIYEYKSEEYAVIPRSSIGTTLALQDTVKKFKKKIENEEIVENKKNRIFGIVGRGATGELDAKTDGSKYSIEQDRGAVWGLGYQRKVNDNFNLGIIIQNNQTTSFSLGKDF
jgi:hypothetical protein